MTVAFVVRPGDLAAVQVQPVQNVFPMSSMHRTLDMGELYLTYEQIWRRQPAVRAVTGFIARQVAAIGTRVISRAADGDVKMLDDHPLALMLQDPRPGSKVTNYSLLYDLMMDRLVYDNAYLMKIRPESGPLAGLVRIPPTMVTPHAAQWWENDGYWVVGNAGHPLWVPAESMIHMHGWNPTPTTALGTPGVAGVSPMETLRDVLAEEFMAQRYRYNMWRRGGQTSGVITRPASTKKWDPTDRDFFRRSWQEQYQQGGGNAGGTPILEDGMTWTPSAMTPKDAQYVESRQLTREETAAMFWLPQSVVGLIDSQTAASVSDQQVQLYQDALPPWTTQMCQDFARQLLPDLEPDPKLQRSIEVVVPYEIKLRGTPGDEIAAMSKATGRPIMTGNEARARMNMAPATDDLTMDQVVKPMNVTAGIGQDGNGIASPHDTAPDNPDNTASNSGDPNVAKAFDMLVKALSRGKAGRPSGSARPSASTKHFEKALTGFYDDLRSQVLERMKSASKTGVHAGIGYRGNSGGSKIAFDATTIMNRALADGDLAEVLQQAATTTSKEAATDLLQQLGYPTDGYNVDQTQAWLKAHTTAVAQSMNDTTEADLGNALADENPDTAVNAMFDGYTAGRIAQAALSETSAMTGFGAREATQQQGIADQTDKTWITGDSPRESHAAIDGETVGMGEMFSIGARWPGDSLLGPEDRAGCNCEMQINDNSGGPGDE